MSSDPPIVLAHFTEAYTFRSTAELLRNVCTVANFIFSPDKIKVAKSGSDNSALTIWEINTNELTKYEYNAYDDDGQQLKEFSAGFNTSELNNKTKIIGKKDGMFLYITPGSNQFTVQIISGKTRPNANYVPIIEEPVQEYEIPEYIRKESDPNIRIPATDFAKMCSNMVSTKCTMVKFIGYPNGVKCIGLLSSQQTGRVDHFGTCSYVDTQTKGNLDELFQSLSFDNINVESKPSGIKIVLKSQEDLNSITVKTAPLIKAMSRFNNLSVSGVVKLYIQEKKPLKIHINIGTYGGLTIFLRDMSQPI